MTADHPRVNPRRLLALLAALTAAVLLLLRINTAPAATTPALTAPAATATATATAADPGAGAAAVSPTASDADYIDDDSLYAPDPHADIAGAAAVADRFARAWTRHTGSDATTWATRLTALATPTLAGALPGIDPAVVPADTVTAAPTLTATLGGADASIPTDAGTLRLTLIEQTGGGWKVDTLDWEPAR
ncbi:hypothetical protein [Actinoplanes sp. G11-F43]|uniref:hypothetical protein n=1 Tax=Actinoplanes sp. G11-F43 TaxID=3424130 RepID=UPI003D333C6E